MSLERLRETRIPFNSYGQLKANRWPDPAAESWQECRDILGQPVSVSPTPGLSRDWYYDRLLMAWRWADDVLSEAERETVRRAREACALEEVVGG